MTIKDFSEDWGMSDRGKKDAERHQKKVDDAIRKSVKDVIAEESIITKKRGRKVRIPVKGFRDYRFIYGNGNGKSGGIGQGEGKDGDVIARREKGPGSNKPGDKPGEDIIEAEVDIDYLIEIMFQDLGLPWIDEKTKIEKMIPSGWKFESISKRGIIPRIHKKRTYVETLKRTMAFVGEIMNDTNCSEEDANIALSMAKGDINDAIDIVNSGRIDKDHIPAAVIDDNDLRYKQIEQDTIPHSNAVVLAMMDVSGSMTLDKKYLARSLLFWLTEFLRKTYDNVDIKFIQHTTEAHVVDEHTFFHKMESGGTMCWTAIDKASYIIDTEYPVSDNNIYVIYMGDGEDWEPAKTVRYIDELMKKKINMFAYCEINTEDDIHGWRPENTLIKEIQKQWKFTCKQEQGTDFYRNDSVHMLLSMIRSKEHIYSALRHILFEPKK
jgi:uncharacterized protein